MSKHIVHHLIWDLYSNKMKKFILSHAHAGKSNGRTFSCDRLQISYRIAVDYDEENEVFSSMKYSVKGPTFLLAILEGLAVSIANKKISSVALLSGEDIFNELSVAEAGQYCTQEDLEAYFQLISKYVNHVIDSYQTLVEELPFQKYTTPDALKNFSSNRKDIEGFFDLNKESQIAAVEQVIEKDIRPYIVLDGGNIKIRDLTKNGVLMIEYEGNCTSCHAAGSTTLSSISGILKSKVHHKLEVLPYLGS